MHACVAKIYCNCNIFSKLFPLHTLWTKRAPHPRLLWIDFKPNLHERANSKDKRNVSFRGPGLGVGLRASQKDLKSPRDVFVQDLLPCRLEAPL